MQPTKEKNSLLGPFLIMLCAISWSFSGVLGKDDIIFFQQRNTLDTVEAAEAFTVTVGMDTPVEGHNIA